MRALGDSAWMGELLFLFVARKEASFVAECIGAVLRAIFSDQCMSLPVELGCRGLIRMPVPFVQMRRWAEAV